MTNFYALHLKENFRNYRVTQEEKNAERRMHTNFSGYKSYFQTFAFYFIISTLTLKTPKQKLKLILFELLKKYHTTPHTGICVLNS